MFSLYNSFLARIELKCFLKIIMRRTQRRNLMAAAQPLISCQKCSSSILPMRTITNHQYPCVHRKAVRKGHIQPISAHGCFHCRTQLSSWMNRTNPPLFLSRTDVERVTKVLIHIQGLPRVFREIYYSQVHSHSSVFSSIFSARPHQERLLCSLIKFSSR